MRGWSRNHESLEVVTEDLPALVKPLLRGWLHLVSFFLAVPVGIWLVAIAPTPVARLAAVVYGLGLIALFGVSGLYHRGRWTPAWRRRMQRLDHSTIYVMIAGSYTPICLLVLRGWLATVLLVAVWIGAAVGAFLSWLPGRSSAIVAQTLYIALGWMAVVAGPQLASRVDTATLVLLAVGGVLFTVGAITLATHWPDPSPRVLGYHEIWHVLVVAAVVCHLIALSGVVRGAGAA